MGEIPKTTESAETAGSVPAHRTGRLAAISALIARPNKRLFLIAGASVLVLLGLMSVAVVAVSPIREPSPIPAPAPQKHLLQEPEKTVDKKSGVEERFEAMKRGDFSRIRANRKVGAVTNARSDAATSAVSRSEAAVPEPFSFTPAARSQGKDSALADKGEKEVSSAAGSVVSSVKAGSPAPEPTISGCNVGASDPKASAAAILGCILEFNAMDSREGLRHAPGKR